MCFPKLLLIYCSFLLKSFNSSIVISDLFFYCFIVAWPRFGIMGITVDGDDEDTAMPVSWQQSSSVAFVLEFLTEAGRVEFWPVMGDSHEQVAPIWTNLGPVIFMCSRLVCLEKGLKSP